jgi:prepilin-type N-terminal cleavage/methylation domain-containing protein
MFQNQCANGHDARGQRGMTLVEVVIALAIAGVTMAGIVSGYVYCTNLSVKDSLFMAANARAMEQMEEVRSAKWDTSSYPVVDQLVSSNFPDQSVTLNKSGTISTNPIYATIKTSIATISSTPPMLRRIHVDCIWQYKGVESITNSVETCRSPDQ